ncbi:AfsR family transcriptional regulator [Paenarthrobacter nitroguajacolicus]|uniref:AfsR family transcriptional regulator n=1 Tax=Paenarthrobacter nitroguajacolicus TaxID=211146 RepID=A0A558GM04_PAENT|nr:BTAD domain-containing putative transcriptional regulator [Paenarthrobacter nitroguajacolicus]TVU57823.1 AfsR family transcriptional regulator [Paenarthrobacter nitroguajacolicus]
MSPPQINVLGPIQVTVDGLVRDLSKRRHREVIAILVAQRGRAIPTASLVEELWDGRPPAGAVGSVRTFIGELRRILEPRRQPRTPAAVLVTVGDGYALRLGPQSVDAWRFEAAMAGARGASSGGTGALLSAALAEWQGDAFEEFAERPWAHAEVTRLRELRQTAVERLAQAHIAAGRPDGAVTMLEPHVTANPWREEGWRLLALALYRGHRQGDALGTLRRAHQRFVNDLGLDPSPVLADLEAGILRRDPGLEPERGRLALTATAYSRSGARAQLEASNAVLGSLAVAGDLQTARTQRLEAIRAAQELNDPELVARIVGGYDVPGIWTRSDDPDAAAAIVAAAEQALTSTSPLSHRTRARLLATIAMESRGTSNRQEEADEAASIARGLGDAQLLCFALSARYMQAFAQAGSAAQRDSIGRQLIATALDADSPTFEINGRLIRMQALCALDDIDAASAEAEAIDQLAGRHERPLATVFTQWFRWTFLGSTGTPRAPGEMPGFGEGLLALAGFTRKLRDAAQLPDGDFGPHERWVRPLLLAQEGQRSLAIEALRQLPDPPNDLLLEATWCIVAQAACELEEPSVMNQALAALAPASGERAAGSGVVDVGNVDRFIAMLKAAGASLD